MTVGVAAHHGDELLDVIKTLHYHSRHLLHEAGGMRAQANTLVQLVVRNVLQLAKQLLHIGVLFEYPEQKQICADDDRETFDGWSKSTPCEMKQYILSAG